MAEWTQEQSTEFTQLYNQLTKLPNYDKIKDSVSSQLGFSSNEPLPYQEAKDKLLSIISEHSGQDGLEAKVNEKTKGKTAANSSKYLAFDYLTKLAAGLAGVAMVATYLL